MPGLELLNVFGRQLTKISIVTSVPMTFSLVGLQAIMNVKFSCPCKAGWNIAITVLIFCAPALFAFVIMLMLLRPFQYKCIYCQKQNKSEASEEKDKSEASEEKDNSESSQEIAFLFCLIPCLVWICLCLIDGDYIACGFTTWNGRYACDKELHPNCLNWCKPTELSSEKNETECYERTRELLDISKIAGYSAAIFFCIIAIILVKLKTSAEKKKKGVASPTNPRNTERADEEVPLAHRIQNRSDVSDIK